MIREKNNNKKRDFEGLALFCDKILGCCFHTFGDKLDNVIGDYECRHF